MSNDGVMRLRCPADIRDPSRPDRHLAMDIRQPIARFRRDVLVDTIGDCTCGRPLIVLKHSQDPWVRT